jgi:UDP-N-acetylmuramoylalanine--D-glutamate ligase
VTPITSFAGRKVAIFGLGGSGLASASALLAGGADVIAWDDNPDVIEQATRAGVPTADLRTIEWSKILALVLAPGVPLTHPAPHWSAALARAAAVEVIGDIELFCRERRHRRRGRLRGDHRDQREIDDDRARGTPDALCRPRPEVGGNIGTAIFSLDPPSEGRVHVIEASSYQIDLAPTLDPAVGILLNVSEDHLDRHGTLSHYAAVKERLVAGVPPDATAIVGIDDSWCAAAADRVEGAGKRVLRVSVHRPLADGLYVEDEKVMQAAAERARGRSYRRHRFIARRAQCTERSLRHRGSACARASRG